MILVQLVEPGLHAAFSKGELLAGSRLLSKACHPPLRHVDIWSSLGRFIDASLLLFWIHHKVAPQDKKRKKAQLHPESDMPYGSLNVRALRIKNTGLQCHLLQLI